MSISLYFGVRLNPMTFERILLHSINSCCKVEDLKYLASNKTNIPLENLELIYRGIILENNSTIESYGIQSGVTLHVLKKKEKAKPGSLVNEADVLYLVSAFKSATKNPNYRGALQRLSRPEVLENIIAATPGLAEDPVAVSIIQDPELLTQLCDANIVRRIVEAHPSLAEAANSIIAFIVHEEGSSAVAGNPGTSSGYSYSLDALSDDEEVDSSQSSDSQPRHGAGENIFASPITTAQLAAALANATGNGNNLRESASGPIITTEMFNQAMQQAFAGTATEIGGSDSPRRAVSVPSFGDLEATSRQLARHLQQMHELGLRDDTINLQALQATDWNVQEAINLVFSGAIGDTDLDEE
ncbi:conserved hypothetical protein [Pediculus humanus corporis]|uniref:Ubiquitin-like protein 7 n=1 Tax=Pediculus humanus subsp. corporis TaxID=121224 RepID=E0VJF2_PEDHC|nr:uncharacterized protein Phum_PHUM244130 [Pediculus humanus corporis]EEB13508.1 conserved hypothetical protein [Pediculus humanus corporis]